MTWKMDLDSIVGLKPVLGKSMFGDKYIIQWIKSDGVRFELQLNAEQFRDLTELLGEVLIQHTRW